MASSNACSHIRAVTTVKKPRRHVCEECEKVVKTIKCERVEFEQQICVKTGEWKTEQICVPGAIVHRWHREPGCWEFDPCTCCSRYIPGKLVRCEVQLPSRTICSVVEGDENIDCTSPLTRAITAGIEPG